MHSKRQRLGRGLRGGQQSHGEGPAAGGREPGEKTPAAFSKRGTRWLPFLCPFGLKHLHGNKILRRLLSPCASPRATEQRGCREHGHIFIEMCGNVSACLHGLKPHAHRPVRQSDVGTGHSGRPQPREAGAGHTPMGPKLTVLPDTSAHPRGAGRDFSLLSPRVDNCLPTGAVWTSTG